MSAIEKLSPRAILKLVLDALEAIRNVIFAKAVEEGIKVQIVERASKDIADIAEVLTRERALREDLT